MARQSEGARRNGGDAVGLDRPVAVVELVLRGSAEGGPVQLGLDASRRFPSRGHPCRGDRSGARRKTNRSPPWKPVNGGVRMRPAACTRSDEHQVPALSLDHAGQHKPRKMQWRHEIDADHGVDLDGIDVMEGRT